MTEAFFQDKFPEGCTRTIDASKCTSLNELIENNFERFADNPAFTCLNRTLTYRELDELSAQFACYLQQHTDLQAGDRIAIQLPNVLQYPIAMFGAMRAGMVVVNTNPLYTEREMEHQFNDSGAKALVVLANFADKVAEVLPKTGIKHVVTTQVGDVHTGLKRSLINSVIKYVKKEVPAVKIPQSIEFRKALNLGKAKQFSTPVVQPDDVAVLQYTGGTTGVSKGAMLTHHSLTANTVQCYELFNMELKENEEVAIAPLPLYHIYAFIVHFMALMRFGAHSILIPNPRDIPGFVKTLKQQQFSVFAGLNTLFVSLCTDEDFKHNVDFSKLKLTISGGMALTKDATDTWTDITGCKISEAYGMTEASPLVSFNPPGYQKLGTIGLPVASTDCKVMDDDGNEMPLGEPGELWVKGPQVMKGYWQRPEATADTITEDGWLKTGDVALIQGDGYMRIVDRKKDMIIVSGFNVFPNEIEDVLSSHDDVVEVAVVGVKDDKSGEAVKAYVVSSNVNLTADDLKQYSKDNLTAYKVPKFIEFRDELPKSNVGKILRRMLRDEE